MADEYDGRVVIDTELDNSGFEKGTDKLISAMKGVERTINGIGETASHAFDVDHPIRMPVEPELPEPEELAERIERVEKELPPVRLHLDSKEYDKTTERLQAKTRRLMAEINRMANTTAQGFKSTSSVIAFNNRLDDTAEKIVLARQELEEFGEQQLTTDAYKETTAAIDKTEKALFKLYDQKDKMEEKGMNKSSPRWADLMQKIKAAEQTLKEYQATAKGMQERGTDSGPIWEKTQAQIQRTEQLLAKYQREADQLKRSGKDSADPRWSALQKQISITEKELEAYEAKAEEMRQAGQAFVDPQATEEYQQMAEDIERAEEALEANATLIRAERIDEAQLAVQTAQAALAEAATNRERRQAVKELAAARAELEAAARIGMPATATPDPSAWQRFGQTVRGALDGAKERVLSFGKRVHDMSTRVTKAVRKVSTGFKRITSAVKSFASKIFKFGGATNALNSLTKKLTSFKGMLVSRIKRTFIGFLFNEIKEAFNELAKFDARFDKSISNLRNRTSELGANVMAAFGGLIRQIEPYITAMINKMSEGVTRINAVLTALRGEDTMQVAVQRTESYAESLSDAAKSADKARAAQQKLNATLTSIDEIHKLDAPQEDTDAAAEAAENAKQIYENVPVDSILGKMGAFGQQIANRIVQGIKSGDWNGAGQAIADALNVLVDKAGEKLRGARPKAEQAARDIADLLNGLVKGFDGEGFGQTLADGFNLGFSTANEFLKRFDFREFGATIGDGITGAVRRFEWSTAGEAIGNGVNGMINTARGVIEHTDWRALGHGLATGFNSLVSTIEWGNAAQTLSAGLIGLLNTISQTIRDTDWQQLGRNVAEFIRNVDWSGVTKALFEAIGAILGGLAGFIWGLISGALDSVKQWWYDSAYENGQFSMEGLLEGIKKALKNIGTWIKRNILDPFINGFKSAFGISSPSKKMKPYGEYVAEGILEGIKDIFGNITGWIKDNIVEPFKRGFSTAFSIVGDKANALFENGKSIANGIKGGISAGWSAISTLIKGKKDDLQKDSTELADSAAAGFSDTGKFTAAGKSIVAAVGSGIDDQSNWDSSVGGVVLKRAGQITGGIQSGDNTGAGRNIAADVGRGIDDQGNWDDNVGGVVMKRAGQVAGGFRDGDYYGAGQYAASEFGRGLEDSYATAIQIAHDFADTMAGVQAGYALNRAQQSDRGYNDANIRTLDTLKTIKTVAESIDGTEVEVSVDAAASVLDKVADKLAAIARTFEAIGKALPDMTAVPVPAVAMGAIAPAQTRVTDDTTRSDRVTASLIERLIGRIEELEEAVATRPIRLESKVVIDRREIGRATAEYNADNGRVTNGNGGVTGW